VEVLGGCELFHRLHSSLEEVVQVGCSLLHYDIPCLEGLNRSIYPIM
jgi:hypothetical protein